MPAFSLVFAPLLLALWLLRLYNAPLPLIEVLNLDIILSFGSFEYLPGSYGCMTVGDNRSLTTYLFTFVCVISFLITRFILIVF